MYSQSTYCETKTIQQYIFAVKPDIDMLLCGGYRLEQKVNSQIINLKTKTQPYNKRTCLVPIKRKRSPYVEYVHPKYNYMQLYHYSAMY